MEFFWVVWRRRRGKIGIFMERGKKREKEEEGEEGIIKIAEGNAMRFEACWYDYEVGAWIRGWGRLNNVRWTRVEC